MIWRNTVNTHANQDPSTDPLGDQAQETKHPRKNRWLLPLLLILLAVAVSTFLLMDSDSEEEVEPVGPLPLRAIGPEGGYGGIRRNASAGSGCGFDPAPRRYPF
jgi:hypothetical protein